MIEKFVSYINDKSKNYTIFDIGQETVNKALNFIKHFQRQKYTPSNVIQIH